MGFVLTHEELAFVNSKENTTFDFYNQQQLMVFWETKPEVVARIVPKPLKPVAPMVTAFVADYPRVNFCTPYKEGGLFIPVEYEGEMGTYCLAMPLDDDDNAIALGREVGGFPKKKANIYLNREGNIAEGWIERHGIRFFHLKAELGGEPNVAEAKPVLAGKGEPEEWSLVYNFRYDMTFYSGKCEMSRVELLRDYNRIKIHSSELGKAELNLAPSVDDPWAELEVVRVLGARYRLQDLSMCKFNIACELDGEELKPYLFKGWDTSLLKFDTQLFKFSK
jgi:acetoacetate decarboxylase